MEGRLTRVERGGMTSTAPQRTSESPTQPQGAERWLSPTELERRLEAHLLIARKLRKS